MTTSYQDTYVWVDSAIGGTDRRNHPQRVDQVHLNGSSDCYTSYQRATDYLVTWVKNHTNAKGKPTVAGFDGVTWTPFLPLDYDCAGNPGRALVWLRQFLDRLEAEDVELDAIRMYFSGCKGFSAEIPHTLFGGFAPSVHMGASLKRAATEIMGAVPFDQKLYDTLRLWRIPNSRHSKTNRYKVQLTVAEVRGLSMREIDALAINPRDISTVPELTPVPDDDWSPNPFLVEIWQRASAKRNTTNATHAEPVGDVIPEGERDPTLTSFAGTMRRRGMSQAVMEAALLVLNAERCRPPLEDDQVCKIAQSVARYAPAPERAPLLSPNGRVVDTSTGEVLLEELVETPRTNGNGTGNHTPPPSESESRATAAAAEPPSKRCTEMWSADQLVELNGDRIRYCPEAGWYAYEKGVWRLDGTGKAMRLVKRMVRTWLKQSVMQDDEDLLKWAVKCHSSTKLESILRLAQTEAKVAINITDFDSNPIQFNVANGTLDLRTGVLSPHDPNDMLSKQCPVVFDPAASCPLWEHFLDDVFNGDQKLIAYVQRFLGYSLTGLQVHHLLALLVGAGRNGKTTLLETVSKVLGDYAKTISSELLLESRENGDYNTAELRGVRLVVISETGERRSLAEARVKKLTGADTLPARHPYGRPFTFTPTHHLWVMTNHKPTIVGVDDGIWSRVKEIDFLNRYVVPPEDADPRTWQPGPHQRRADEDLAAKLEQELPGILTWLVNGAIATLRGGLREPASVTEATERYREQMDTLGGFLEDCCDIGAYLSDSSARLYGAYKSWCASNGVDKPVASNKFGMLLTERGAFVAIKPTTGDRQRRWSGLQVKPEHGADDER